MGTLLQDLRYAARSLRRNPGFALVATLTLALGIGVTTAVFSVVYEALLRPLPYADPDRLVVVWPQQTFNKTLLRDVRTSIPALQSVSGFAIWPMSLVGDGAPPEELTVAEVSPNHFDMLGARPGVGRTFLAEEGLRAAAGVVVLSHAFWMRRYGGDSGIVGRVIRLAGAGYQARRVIGVMPPQFRWVAGEVAAWVPLEEQVSGAADPTWYLGDVARLAPGATRAEALAQLRALGERLQPAAPQVFSPENMRQATVDPLARVRAGGSAAILILWLLLASVGLVLLIACANVANLLLARGEGRMHEFALRRALGARRGRIVAAVLVEAGLLALGGCAVGIVLAQGILAGILALAPVGFIGVGAIVTDRAVLATALGVSLLSALGFGAVPALFGARGSDGDALRGSRGLVGDRSTSRVSRVLIAAELALAVPLLIGATLLLRTLTNLFAVSPGFQAEQVLVLRPNPPLERVSGPDQFIAFYDEALRRIRALPQVESAAATLMLPVTSSAWAFPTVIDGVEGSETAPPSIDYVPVTPDYFETLRIPLLAGRTLARSDRPGTPRVAVINRALAKRFWPDGSPLGRTLRPFSRTGDPFTIVGVVGDVHLQGLNADPRPAMYVADQQLRWGRQTGSAETALWLVIRTRDPDPLRSVASVREAIWSVDPETTITGSEPLKTVVARSASATTFVASLLTGFSFLAVLLGVIGVYGVTAYTVAKRTSEFGVRIALGATPTQLLRTSMAASAVPLVVGLLVGSLAAALGSRVLQGMLFQVGRHDPVAFVVVPLLLGAAAVLAALLPARRAARVDPMVALRAE